MSFTFDEVLEFVENLDISEREILIDIVQKRLHLQRRNEIISDVKIGRKEYESGKLKKGSSKDLMRAILK